MEVPMVKRHVWGNEWYPVYEMDTFEPEDDYKWEILEFTDEEFAELTDLFAKFQTWQEKLEERLDASRAAWEAANPEESKRLEEQWAKARAENDAMERRRRGGW